MSESLNITASDTATRPSPVELSPRALEEIKRILTEKDIPSGFGLRIGVKGGGCSGMSYILGFDRTRDHDVTFEHEGVSIVIDKRHGLYLMGTMVDYQDGLDARGFTFNNPNATSTCGCGSSFGV
ncbi:MAG: iron-sulfur cluster assembly accessory protein [Rhodothermales bacterium]|nr:iron-sulfur cluster assembly accessory protein [Rhodothermales bacterium]